MKSQDIFLLLKLVALEKLNPKNDIAAGAPAIEIDAYSVRALAQSTGISKSEVANVLARCYESGLAKKSRESGKPIVNRAALNEFLLYGLRYVFPVKPQQLTRGIPTGLSAPIFEGELFSAGAHLPVWPEPSESTLGLAITPLFKTVTTAIRNDLELYQLLALVDAIRLGLPRERKLAAEILQRKLIG